MRMTSALVFTQWNKDGIDENLDWASFDRATGRSHLAAPCTLDKINDGLRDLSSSYLALPGVSSEPHDQREQVGRLSARESG